MLEPGDTVLNRYALERTLGRGAAHATWLAADESGERYVIKAASLAEAGTWAQLEAFERDSRRMEKIRHSRLPECIGFATEERENEAYYYFITSFVEGESLKALVERNGRVEYEDGVEIVRSALGALTALHGVEPPVIHGDVVPENLIRSVSGDTMLVGFTPAWKGAAEPKEDFNSVDTSGLEQPGGSTADPLMSPERRAYCASEHLAGHPVPASDLYSVGMSLVYALTGKHPYVLPTRRLKPIFHDPDDRRALYRVIDRMIEPESSQRDVPAADIVRYLDESVTPNRESGGVSGSTRAGDDVKRRDSSASISPRQRTGAVSIRENRDRRVLIARNPDAEKPESQLAGLVLDLWLTKPWIVMIIAAVLTGGPGFIPFLVLHMHPRAKAWARRMYSRHSDTRIIVDDRTLSVRKQLRGIRRDDVVSASFYRVPRENGIVLEVAVDLVGGREEHFYVSNLTDSEADDVEAFLNRCFQ